MIDFIKIKTAQKGDNFIIGEIAGFGLKIFLNKRYLSNIDIGENLTILTQLIIKDDALILLGFESNREKDIFNNLCTVSGVGRKSAMAILDILSPNDIYLAIKEENTKVFTNVPGIGIKSAKLIIASLSSKIKNIDIDIAHKDSSAIFQQDSALIINALVGLGYSASQASNALLNVKTEGKSQGEILKNALQILQK